MGWNDSDDKKNNPWQSGGDKGPPDLEEVVRDLQRKLGGLFGGGRRRRGGDQDAAGGGGGGSLALVAVAALVVWAFRVLYD